MHISKSKKNRRWSSAYESASAKATKQIGRIFGEELRRNSPKSRGALIVSLRGDLGSGKTTFVQGLAKGLGIRRRMTSPTFVLLRVYAFKKNKGKLVHIDAYRINTKRGAMILENDALYANQEDIVVIEWPERIPHIVRKPDILITFAHGNNEYERIITIQGTS